MLWLDQQSVDPHLDLRSPADRSFGSKLYIQLVWDTQKLKILQLSEFWTTISCSRPVSLRWMQSLI